MIESYIIEPCCYEKQLTELLSRIEGKTNVAHFYSFSDWDLSVLLPFFVNRTPGGEVTLSLVQVENATLNTIKRLLDKKIPDEYTKESVNLVNHLSLITRGENRQNILSVLSGYGDRLSVCEDNIGFRCITCANNKRHFVVQGSINQQTFAATQMYTVTTGKELYEQAQSLLASKARLKRIVNWEESYKRLLGITNN